MSAEIACKQNILVTDFHLLKLLLVVLGFGSQTNVCGFSRQNICSVYTVRRSLEGHFLGQMEAANSFDKYNKAKGEPNSRISRSAMNF